MSFLYVSDINHEKEILKKTMWKEKNTKNAGSAWKLHLVNNTRRIERNILLENGLILFLEKISYSTYEHILALTQIPITYKFTKI